MLADPAACSKSICNEHEVASYCGPLSTNGNLEHALASLVTISRSPQ